MLLLLILLSVPIAICQENLHKKPYSVFPIPYELPNRNERSEQCWLRIEDMEVVDTITVWCHIAHSFLTKHISEYNKRKSAEDGINLDLWDEGPISSELQYGSGRKDWMTTTILDPTVHTRIYVTTNADCKLVMYSREGVASYKVECAKILYSINHHLSNSAYLDFRLSLMSFTAILLIHILI